MPCILLNYTGDGLDGLQQGGISEFLGSTTFGNLYPMTQNITGRIKECAEFENSRCCEEQVTGRLQCAH